MTKHIEQIYRDMLVYGMKLKQVDSLLYLFSRSHNLSIVGKHKHVPHIVLADNIYFRYKL